MRSVFTQLSGRSIAPDSRAWDALGRHERGSTVTSSHRADQQFFHAILNVQIIALGENGTSFAPGPTSIASRKCRAHRHCKLQKMSGAAPGRNVISTMVPSSRIADAVGTTQLVVWRVIGFHPASLCGVSAKAKARVYAKSFGAYCVELEAEDVVFAGVTLSASDTTVRYCDLAGRPIEARTCCRLRRARASSSRSGLSRSRPLRILMGVPSAGIALQRPSFFAGSSLTLASAAGRLMAAERPSDTMRERHEIRFENVRHSSRYHDSGRFIGRADFSCPRRVGSAARPCSFRDVVQ